MRPEHPSDHDEPEQETSRAKEPARSTLPIYDPRDSSAIDRDDEPEPTEIDDEFDDEDDEDDDFDDEDEDDDEELQEELLPQLIEGEPRTVLITGACGNIGRKLRAAWTDTYELVLIDKEVTDDDADVIEADLAVLDDDWITHFHGVDTVVHLAANGNGVLAPLG